MKPFSYFKKFYRNKPKISESGGWVGPNEHYLDEKLFSSIRSFIIKKSIKSCNDLGAGCQAKYSKKIQDIGIIVNAYDFNPEILKNKDISVNVIDLTKHQTILKADLTVCLEVGEHIPEKYFSILLQNIVLSTNKYILLSWAIIGQEGHGHVNCKSNFDIIYYLYRLGFKLNIDDTYSFRNHVSLPWFKNTLFLFEKIDL
jgi:hypothetical protein